MKLLQWTLFIDMLGYKNINGSIDNKEKALELINFMKENAEIFQAQDSSKRKILYSQEEFNLYEFYEPKYCFVSDSLIISFEPKEIKRKEKFKNEFVRHSAVIPPFLIELMGRKSKALLLFKNRWTTIY